MTTALEVLKDALADHGEITDDDRRLASERSGLPEPTFTRRFTAATAKPMGSRVSRDDSPRRPPGRRLLRRDMAQM